MLLGVTRLKCHLASVFQQEAGVMAGDHFPSPEALCCLLAQTCAHWLPIITMSSFDVDLGRRTSLIPEEEICL